MMSSLAEVLGILFQGHRWLDKAQTSAAKISPPCGMSTQGAGDQSQGLYSLFLSARQHCSMDGTQMHSTLGRASRPNS
eukprot:4501330-Amphidinium_carterae.2